MKLIGILLVSFLFLATASLCQEISRHEADSMIVALNKTKPGIERIELLLNLAQFHIYKPDENKIDLDSAAVYIEAAKALNKKINSVNAYGYLLLTESCLIKERAGKTSGPSFFISAEGKKMMEKAVKTLESGTNKEYLGRAYYELSLYYDYNDTLQLSKKIELVRQSTDAFQRSGSLKRKAGSLEMLADLYNHADEHEKAIQVLKEALAIYKSIHYSKLQGVYVLLGSFYYYRRDYVPALSNLLTALKTAQSMKDRSMQLCQINNFLGQLYNAIDRRDMVLKYLNDALEIARKYNDENAIFFVLANLTTVYNNLGPSDQSLKVLGYMPKKFWIIGSPAQKTALNTMCPRTYLGLKQLDSAIV